MCSFKNTYFLLFISKYNWELKTKECKINCFIFHVPNVPFELFVAFLMHTCILKSFK